MLPNHHIVCWVWKLFSYRLEMRRFHFLLPLPSLSSTPPCQCSTIPGCGHAYLTLPWGPLQWILLLPCFTVSGQGGIQTICWAAVSQLEAGEIDKAHTRLPPHSDCHSLCKPCSSTATEKSHLCSKKHRAFMTRIVERKNLVQWSTAMAS